MSMGHCTLQNWCRNDEVFTVWMYWLSCRHWYRNACQNPKKIFASEAIVKLWCPLKAITKCLVNYLNSMIISSACMLMPSQIYLSKYRMTKICILMAWCRFRHLDWCTDVWSESCRNLDNEFFFICSKHGICWMWIFLTPHVWCRKILYSVLAPKAAKWSSTCFLSSLFEDTFLAAESSQTSAEA